MFDGLLFKFKGEVYGLLKWEDTILRALWMQILANKKGRLRGVERAMDTFFHLSQFLYLARSRSLRESKADVKSSLILVHPQLL